MAAQFQVAYSASVIGAGIVAGGPFYCAGTSPLTPFVVNATTLCMNPLPGLAPNAHYLFGQARVFARLGDIDPVENLARARLYVFSGTADRIVTSVVVDQTFAFYRLAGVPEAQIRYERALAAGHAILTDRSEDAACDSTGSPFINYCGFNQSQHILRHIYGELAPPGAAVDGRLFRFDQQPYIRTFMASMSPDAYVYVPTSCNAVRCAVHVVFHGCGQGTAEVFERFARTTGYNELAEANDIIVLYPRVEPRSGFFLPYNPQGCWDFWGYSSFNQLAPVFYAKSAPQLAAVKAMLEGLGAPRETPPH